MAALLAALAAAAVWAGVSAAGSADAPAKALPPAQVQETGSPSYLQGSGGDDEDCRFKDDQAEADTTAV